MTFRSDTAGGDESFDESPTFDVERDQLREALAFDPLLPDDDWTARNSTGVGRGAGRRALDADVDDEPPSTSYVETLLEDIDRKLEKLVSNEVPNGLELPNDAATARVLMLAIRQEFATMRRDQDELKDRVDFLIRILIGGGR